MHPYLRFLRPYTLWAPALGIMSGSAAAFGALPALAMPQGYLPLLLKVLLAGFIAAILNAGSNGLNQIYDLEIDRRNKPDRPLISGEMSLREAWIISIFFYVFALLISLFISWIFALMVWIAAFCTIIYSAPPLRTKQHWLAATLTIAIPRGALLKVAGWSVLRDVDNTEPWFIGSIFGLFLLGAVTTKDYADIPGDQQENCITLPIRFGVKKSAWMIAPFFIFPFALFPLGVYGKILTGNGFMISTLGIVLMLWGAYVVAMILRDPDALASSENHPSWKHMYLMMIFSQIGLAIAYMY